MATEQKNTLRDDLSDYYDILLLGRTGLGKSTTGNKLLGIAYEPLVKLTETEITLWSRVDDAVDYFVIGDTSDSVTTECKVLSNERYCRVLDTPGFASSRIVEECGGQECNQRICLWTLQEQEKHDLAFRRVLYFLPERGPLERADGTLQEEIKVMHDFLGGDVFNVMVIIATNKRDMKYQREFDEEDISATEKMFTTAFERVTGQNLPKCPPILYLSFTEMDILNKVVSAEVIFDKPVMKKDSIVIDVTPTKDVDLLVHNAKQNHPGKRLCLRDRCRHCDSTLIYKDSPTGKWEVKVVKESDEVACEQSKCHPLFIPEYNCVVRIAIGIFYLVLFVITSALCGKLPRKSDSIKICPICRLPRGSVGCSDVGKQVEIKGRRECIKISHSTHLDSILETDAL